MNKTYKEINERPELYDNYEEFIDSEGYLYDDFEFDYDIDEKDIEEDVEVWE